MSRKTKVELSPRYNEIVEKLNEGRSCQEISDWLKSTYNEHISRISICNFRKKLNNKIEKEVEQLKQEKKQINKDAVEKITGKAKILLICEELFNEVPKYVKKIDWNAMNNRDIIELMKLMKDIAKIRLDFNKSSEIEVNVNNNDFTSYFNDDLLREIIDDKEKND